MLKNSKINVIILYKLNKKYTIITKTTNVNS